MSSGNQSPRSRSDRGLALEMQALQAKIDQTNLDLAMKQSELSRLQGMASKQTIGYQFDEGQKLLEDYVREMDKNKKEDVTFGSKVSDPEQAYLVQWLMKNKVSVTTIDLLMEAECSSLTVLRLMSDKDLCDLGVTIPQRRLLQAVLQSSSDVGEFPLKPSATAAMADGGNQDPGQLHCDIFLGMGVRGSQKPYLDITDFVSVRSPYDGASEMQTVITAKSDGSYEVKPQSFGKTVSLDKVSMAQWIEANTLIMNQLLGQGVHPQAYMSYTVMVSQIAQKYEWPSVLLWDREYRKMQANLGFRWGTDQSHLRDVLLIPKQKFTAKTAGPRTSQTKAIGRVARKRKLVVLNLLSSVRRMLLV